jgi:hypothetical protein
MTSDRQRAANRKNSEKSTGPRSAAGLRRSSRNARRRGLAVAIASDTSVSGDLEKLITALAGGTGEAVGEFTVQLAEAEIDLLRIRKIKAMHCNAAHGGLEAESYDPAKLNEDLAKLERYEKRAFLRRKRALDRMDTLK